MESLRDDDVGSSSDDPSGQSDNEQDLKEPLKFLMDVKSLLGSKKQQSFLQIMRGLNDRRINIYDVKDHVGELFGEYPELIAGFNTFLPVEHQIIREIEIDVEVEVIQEDFKFLRMVKDRFNHDKCVHESFLDVLERFRGDFISANEFSKEAERLFQGHHDLINEFNKFSRDAPAKTWKHVCYQNFIMPRDARVYAKESEESYDSHSDGNFSDDNPDLEHNSKRIRYKKNGIDNINGEDHVHGKEDVKQDCMYLSNGENRQIPSQGTSPDSNKSMLKSLYTQGFIFCDKVKEKLQGDSYQEFLKLLHMFSKKKINIMGLKNMVCDILGEYPDLLNSFNDFLMHCKNIDGYLAGLLDQKASWNEGFVSGPVESVVTKIEGEPNTVERQKDRDRDTINDREKEKLDKGFCFDDNMSEPDISKWEQATPSYRFVPENHPWFRTNWTEADSSILNNVLVCTSSGSEGNSFKHNNTNQYEQILFRCEDDRLELVVLLEVVHSTIKQVEQLLEKIQDTSIELEQIQVEDHFSRQSLRCIEKLYGDYGLDVMSILHNNVGPVLPVLLTRLKQKQKAWSRCYSDFDKVWAAVFAKYYHRSLDHHGPSFK